MTFPDIPTVILSAPVLLLYGSPPIPSLETFLSHFLHQITCILPVSHPPPQWSCFTFLAAAVTPGSLLTSEDLELGASGEIEHETVAFLVWVTSRNMIFSAPKVRFCLHSTVYICTTFSLLTVG